MFKCFVKVKSTLNLSAEYSNKIVLLYQMSRSKLKMTITREMVGINAKSPSLKSVKRRSKVTKLNNLAVDN